MKTRHIIAAIVLSFFIALAAVNHLAFRDSADIPKDSLLMQFPWYWVVSGIVLSWIIAKRKKSNRVPSPFNTYPE